MKATATVRRQTVASLIQRTTVYFYSVCDDLIHYSATV